MSFVFPGFLVALGVLGIPVLIHLLKFRRFKKIDFSDTFFLREITQENQSRNRIRKLLVLSARLLALACLVLAFAMPFFGNQDADGLSGATRSVCIFIDNSPSMEARGSIGTLLDEAKEKAREIATAYRPGDRFQLLTQDFKGEHQRWLSRDEFLNALGEISHSGNAHGASEIFARQSDLVKAAGPGKADHIWISDFQKNAWNLNLLQTDSLANLILMPLKPGPGGNVSIDSVWFNQPVLLQNEKATLFVNLKNHGQEDVSQIPVKLILNGSVKSIASADIAAGASREMQFSFVNGQSRFVKGQILVEEQPVVFDNAFFFSFPCGGKMPVLLLEGQGPNSYLRSLFDSDSTLELTVMNGNSISYNTIDRHALIILDGWTDSGSGLIESLKKSLSKGNSLFLIPNKNEQKDKAASGLYTALGLPVHASLSDSLSESVDGIKTRHPFFKNVFETEKMKGQNLLLPSVRRYYPWLGGSPPREDILMSLKNGNAFFSVFNSGNGKIYHLSSPLDDSFGGLQRHALMVPVFFNAALQTGKPFALFHRSGNLKAIDIPAADESADAAIRVVHAENGKGFIPRVRQNGKDRSMFMHEQANIPGHYLLLQAGADTLDVLSVNAPAAESELIYYSSGEMEKATAGIKGGIRILESAKPGSAQIKAMVSGEKAWRIFLIASIAFFILEALLLRFLKSA